MLGSGTETLDAAISPDERAVVFVASIAGVPYLWHRPLDTEEARRLPGSDGAKHPAWLPAGDAVMFFAHGKLRLIALASGALRDLADAPDPRGVAWLPDGTLVFSSGAMPELTRLSGEVTPFAAVPLRASLTATPATTLQPGDRRHLFPTSVAGGGFVYVALREDGRRLLRLTTPAGTRDLTQTTGHGILIGEHLLHVRDDTLVGQQVPTDPAAPLGRAAPIALGVGTSPDGRSLMAVSRRLALISSARSSAAELVWFDLTGTRRDTVGEPGDYQQVRLSPDDRVAAATAVQPQVRSLDVFLLDLVANTPARQLTVALAGDSDPVWSPDGRRVLFRSLQGGRANLFTRRATMERQDDVPLVADGLEATASDWAGDAPRSPARVLVSLPSASRGSDVVAVDTTTGTRDAVTATSFNETDARWSPDRSWVSLVSDDFGHSDVFAIRRGNDMRVRVSAAGGSHPRWARDGHALYFLRGATIMRADRLDGADALFAVPRPVLSAPGMRDFDVAHRSDRLLVVAPILPGLGPEVRVILDWRVPPPSDRRP
jgi:Tol biopolymer transport system component